MRLADCARNFRQSASLRTSSVPARRCNRLCAHPFDRTTLGDTHASCVLRLRATIADGVLAFLGNRERRFRSSTSFRQRMNVVNSIAVARESSLTHESGVPSRLLHNHEWPVRALSHESAIRCRVSLCGTATPGTTCPRLFPQPFCCIEFPPVPFEWRCVRYPPDDSPGGLRFGYWRQRELRPEFGRSWMSCAVISPPVLKVIARSRMFSSSRTLPGKA